jgi:hypothetical protein
MPPETLIAKEAAIFTVNTWQPGMLFARYSARKSRAKQKAAHAQPHLCFT